MRPLKAINAREAAEQVKAMASPQVKIRLDGAELLNEAMPASTRCAGVLV